MLTGALVVLLPALAVLQYRWVGQVSEAERERMLRNLRHAALQFREAFDGELARAFVGLQVDGALVRDEAWDRYAERYTAWASTAAQPSLVADVFLVDASGTTVRLRRWNARGGSFQAVPWSGALATARAYFETELAAFQAPTGKEPPRLTAAFRGDPSLVVSPLMHLRLATAAPEPPVLPLRDLFGFTVIQLNLPFIRGELLPALARRHFPDSDGTGYRVAVVDTQDPGAVLFRSSSDVPTDPARADVAEPLFSGLPDALMVLAHTSAPAAVRETRNLVVNVVRGGATEGAVRARILGRQPARWRLLVQDGRGSLDAAVAAVRRRNMAISFGILLLMGVSIGLLALSSRRAQRLARQQMEFVAGVSHELRTPVAVIHAAAENLAQGVVDDPGRVRRYGEAIESEAKRLREMVERVLQFAGLESGRPLAAVPLPIADLVHAAADAAEAADRGLVIERKIAGDLPPVPGDERAIRSAVENLLANAAKYGGADRWIGVRVEPSHARRGDEIAITIEDHGAGIAAADLPHIFEPFYRGADALARQVQGSGLGLALVRRIVEEHGGRISVATRAREGSAFTVHLPAASSHPTPQPFDGRLSTDEAAAR